MLGEVCQLFIFNLSSHYNMLSALNRKNNLSTLVCFPAAKMIVKHIFELFRREIFLARSAGKTEKCTLVSSQ